MPTQGAFEENNFMKRVSHDISVFSTQLSSIVDAAKNTPAFDIHKYQELSDGVIGSLHACAKELQSKSQLAL